MARKMSKKQRIEWAEKKKARAEQLRALVDGALDRFIDETDAARQSDELQQWLQAMAQFHQYSFRNSILIMMQLWAMELPLNTKVAGYHTWKKIGRHVKKGEKAVIEILRPHSVARKARADEIADGSAVWDEKRGEHVFRYMTFRPAFVFHAGQTEGEEIEFDYEVKGDDNGLLERLQQVATDLKIEVAFDDVKSSGGARGVSRGGRVSVDKTMSVGGRAATLAHELAHELLHWDDDGIKNIDRSVAEAEAECAAYVVCAAYGVEHPGAAKYVAAWQAGTKPDDAKRVLTASMGRVRDVASKLLGGNGPDGDAA